MKRILFTTACQDYTYDYIASNTVNTDSPRLRYERSMSFGLRFLEANIPDIKILEYPKWTEFLRVVQMGWDIIGFSFYTNEIPVIKKMVRAARDAGIPELWGGNYGVLTPGGSSLFDRVAVGYSESLIAEWLGAKVRAIVHPPLIVPLKLGKGLGLIPLGILFTVRGCNRACTFCQSPIFCDHELCPISLDSIEQVIQTYRRLHIGALLILDECFGNIPDHAEKVISFITKANLPWLPMTRADILFSKLSEWSRRGLTGALLGIENFSTNHLRSIKKCGPDNIAKNVIRRLKAEDRLIVGFYMIGFEDDTQESLESDLLELVDLNLDLAQVCILTPFHQTPLWNSLLPYGIQENDLSKFDGKHLVWNHPNFRPGELERILQRFFLKAFPAGREAETIRRFARHLIRRVGLGAGLSFIAGSFLYTNAMGAWLRRRNYGH